MSRGSRQPAREDRARAGRAGVPTGRLVTRPQRRAATARIPQRRVVDSERSATAAEVSAMRAQLLRFALTLPDVAIGGSRLDAEAAGLFVRLPLDDRAGFEMREFATVRNRPRWSLSVLLPIGATAELQRLGWGRPQASKQSGPLLLELVRPRQEADLLPLQRVIATAHRVAADAQGRNR
jgi:hypothetical protein